MKFALTFKTPNVTDRLDELCETEDERNEAKEFASKFVEYDEYVLVEFDTETGTAVVNPLKR